MESLKVSGQAIILAGSKLAWTSAGYYVPVEYVLPQFEAHERAVAAAAVQRCPWAPTKEEVSFSPKPPREPQAPTPAPDFQLEREEAKARKRLASRRDWAPPPQWKECQVETLGFNFSKVERRNRWIPFEERSELELEELGWSPERIFRAKYPVPTWYHNFSYWVWWHENMGSRRMRCAGLMCPPINGSWWAYAPAYDDEPLVDWRRRVFAIRRATNYGKKLEKQRAFWELGEVEQLRRSVQKAGCNYNPFRLLKSEVYLDPPMLEYPCLLGSKTLKTQKKVYVPFVAREGPRFYRLARLVEKKRLAVYQANWRLRRAARRAGLARVVTVEQHRVTTLKSQLLSLAEERYQEMRRDPSFRIEGHMMQPDTDAHGDQQSNVTQKSTTEVHSQSDVSEGSMLPATCGSNTYDDLSAAPSIIGDRTFHDRYYPIADVTWSVNEAQNETIYELNVPDEIFSDADFRQSPNYVGMSRHMYWKGDIEFLIVLSSNVRQFGMVQWSFYYGDQMDVNYGLRTSIYSNSQRIHGLTSASECNDVCIRVPFEYVFPIMAINRVQGKGYRSLGRLLGKVVIPLQVVSPGPTEVTFQILVSFHSNKFSGMVGQAVAEGQMFGLASIIAAKSLLDANRDNPTVVSPVLPVQPINSSSWCYGTGISEFNNVLRLDPNSTLPYECGRIPELNEMTVDYVKQVWGMIKTFVWKKDDVVGSLLWSLNATPLDDMTVYPNDGISYVVPPIGVLSSLFSYWRGSLELRLDIVGAADVSGSIMIVYVPRYTVKTAMSLKKAKSCPNSIYEIKGNRQISFKIPFVASQMFWPRRSTLSSDYPVYGPPGAVFIYVFRRLVLNTTVPPEVHFVAYLRGGDDFEVAIPASPSLGLCFNPSIFIPRNVSKSVIPKRGYSPIYPGSWRFAYMDYGALSKVTDLCTDAGLTNPPLFDGNVQTWSIPIMRYGEVSDHVAQVEPVGFKFDAKKYYLLKLEVPLNNAQYSFLCKNGLITFKYSHFLCAYDGDYAYIYPLSAEQAAKGAVFVQYCNDHPEKEYTAIECWLSMVFAQMPTLRTRNDSFMTPQTGSYFSSIDYFCSVVLPPLASAQAGDEATSPAMSMGMPQATAAGSLRASNRIFGEQFMDLKDYCRRYQLYAAGTVGFTEESYTTHGRVISIRFPVMPQGLDLDIGIPTQINEYWNRTREGPIPVIASGYRFFTGGIRFRVCFNVVTNTSAKRSEPTRASDALGKIFVQHRPNIISDSKKVTMKSGVQFGTDDLELPGYAAHYQFDKINNVISIEVPFYRPCLRTYLQRPSDVELAALYSDLGEIAIGISLSPFSKIRFDYDIYYALADDARFSVFVGFPPVLDITAIPSYEPSQDNRQLEETIVIIDSCSNLDSMTYAQLENTYNETVQELKSRYNVVIPPFSSLNRSWSVYQLKRVVCSAVNLLKSQKDKIYTLHPDGDFVVVKGQMLRSMFGIGETVERADAALEKVEALADKLENTKIFENAAETTENIRNISETVKDLVCNAENDSGDQSFLSKWYSLVVNAITNLVHVLLNLNLKSVCVAIVSFLTQLKVISLDFSCTIAEKLAKLFSFASSPQPNLEAVVEGQMARSSQEEEDDSVVCGYVSSVFAGICAMFSFVPKMAKSQYRFWGDILLEGVSKFTFTANNLFRFVKNNLAMARHMGEYLFSDHPSVRKLSFLQQHGDIYEWAEKVVEYTDPRKEMAVKRSPKMASHAYVLAAQASLLHIKMLDLNLTGPQVNIMQTLIKKIQNLRDKLATLHTAPPVRWEPFMFELYGSTGIGKSQLLRELPYRLFRDMGLTHEGELIYHRQPGNAYWNNLTNQPVCVIDEKFPIEGPNFSEVQVSELFQLKSCCVFNPPMADIPDKGVRYNPILVEYASNSAFPRLSGVRDHTAVWRRRDALIEVCLTEEAQTRCGVSATYEDLRRAGLTNDTTFNWLRFRFHRNVTNPCTGDEAWYNWLTYEQFCTELSTRFRVFFTREEVKYRREIARMRSLEPADGEPSRLNELFDYKWLDDLDRGQEGYEDVTRQLNLKHNEIVKSGFNLKREIFELKIKGLFQELFGEVGAAAATNREVQALLTKIEGQGVSEERFRNKCIHTYLRDILVTYPSEVSWSEAHRSFDVVNTPETRTVLFSSINGMHACNWNCSEYYSFLSKCNSSFFFDKDRLSFPLNKCLEETVCLCADLNSQISFISTAFVSKPDISNYLKVGRSLKGLVPSEYLDSISGREKKIKEHQLVVEELPKIRKYWESFKESFYSIQWKKWLKRLAIAIAIFSFIGAAFGLWNMAFGSSSTQLGALSAAGGAASAAAVRLSASENQEVADRIATLIANGAVSGDNKINHINTSLKGRPADKVLSILRAEGQGIHGIHNRDVVFNKLTRNSFFLDFENESVPRNPARCLGLCDRYALIVDHYFEAWTNTYNKYKFDTMMYMPCLDKRVSQVNISWHDLKYFKVPDSCLGVIELPKRIPNFVNILNLLAPRDDHKRLSRRGTVAELKPTRDCYLIETSDVNFIPYNDNTSVSGCDLWQPFQVYHAYEYTGFSGKGKCGSLLLAHNVQYPIVGMHVAGNEQLAWGLSEVLYREMFECLLPKNKQRAPSPVIATGQGLTPKWFLDAEVIHIGKVPPKFEHKERGISRIIPSEVQTHDRGFSFTIYSEPGIMHPNDPRIRASPFSPMLQGCLHHGKPLKSFPDAHIRLAIEDLKTVVLAYCRPQRQFPGLLSPEEAVGGFEGRLGYEHITFDTSEGYPFVGFRPSGVSNKRWLFEFDEEGKFSKIKPMLQDVLKLKWMQRAANQIPSTVFTDCLKDATVDKSKVLVPGKTRIFSIAPVDFTIQERQCTLDFVVSYMTCRLNLEHMIGVNPDSLEWTLLSQKLLKQSDNIVTGDYSKYGDSLPVEFTHGAFEIIRAWYKHNGCQDFALFQQLEIMPFEISHSIHLMFDTLYQCVCGQPSGNSLTVIINSLANSLYMRVAYLGLMHDTEFCSLADFAKYVTVFSYGDDLIMSVNDKIKDKFNGESISSYFSQFGLKFTNADKSSNVVPYVTLDKASFLKRGFAEHPFRQMPRTILAPLEIKSVEDTVNWVWKESFGRDDPQSLTFRELTLQICHDSVRNAYGRGPEYYQQWVNKLRDFWLKRNVRFNCDSWADMDVKIFTLNLDLSPYHKFKLPLPFKT